MKILRQRADVTTFLTGQQTIVKQAHTALGQKQLENAWRFLQAMDFTGFAPHPLNRTQDSISMEYIVADDPPVGEKAIIHSQERLRINAIRALLTLQQRNIIHSDLTRYGFIIRNGVPVIIDWDEARFAWEVGNKRVGMDADHMYPAILTCLPDTNRILRRWLAIREQIKHLRGFGIVHDYGTLYGDFAAFAKSEGLYAIGYDNGGFDSSCIDIARARWAEFGCSFWNTNILDVNTFDAHVSLLLSVWTYILRDYGKLVADDFLFNVISHSELVFFENQLHGDGFGPEIFKSDEDIFEYLKRMGKPVKPIATIDVTGRPFKRTVWQIG